MMHGQQKLTLTHDSVQEALHDYLSKHLLPGMEIQVKAWLPAKDTYGDAISIDVEFVQNAAKGDIQKVVV